MSTEARVNKYVHGRQTPVVVLQGEQGAVTITTGRSKWLRLREPASRLADRIRDTAFAINGGYKTSGSQALERIATNLSTAADKLHDLQTRRREKKFSREIDGLKNRAVYTKAQADLQRRLGR